MSMLRPQSNDQPREQSSKTPSGKEVPMAMSMMVDSMVRMIQKGSKGQSCINKQEQREGVDEY